MNKKILFAGVTTALLAVIVVGVYFLFLYEKPFKESTAKLTVLEEPVKRDKTLSTGKLEEGRLVHTGSPYKFEEVIYVQGVGVQVSKGEVFTDLFELASEEKQKYLSFKIRILNYNDYPYTIVGSQIVFEHKRSESETQRQDILNSGYERWKYLENSFIFGEIKKNTVREGFIYTPITENALKDGKLTIYINNVPVTFKY